MHRAGHIHSLSLALRRPWTWLGLTLSHRRSVEPTEFYSDRPSLVWVAETNTSDLVIVPEHMRKTSYSYQVIHGFKLEFPFCYLFVF